MGATPRRSPRLRAFLSQPSARREGPVQKAAAPSPAAPPPPLVANPLAELAGQRAYATLTGRLSTIAQAHALLGPS